MKSLGDLNLQGQRVLLRADLNVPLQDGQVANDRRIRMTLSTLCHLLERGCRVVLCSHLGRPKGKVVPELSLRPVARRLEDLLGFPVPLAPSCTGPEVERMVNALPPGRVVLLENLRFHPGEEKNDPDFARALGRLGDLFVQDAFGVVHRAHASTVGVPRFLPSVAGLLLEKEIQMLSRALNPRHPFVAVLGGAKIADKVKVVEGLADRVDRLLIGGAIANTFLKTLGRPVGRSLVEDEALGFARDLLERTHRKGTQVLLPEDVVVAEAFSADAPHRVLPVEEVPAEGYILDIGPRTVERYRKALQGARTVVWNGPMGLFEWPPFRAGTEGVARAIADLRDAETVVGGGETAEAVEELGLENHFTWVSTGGGASLAFLEGRDLPGLKALEEAQG